ncbi:glycoside hydrolase family 61 protein [Niveomyces insectorum RCEF 264]|uniref:lytic cellulose monooxygenase (C4-dehydrogenating) n=1 Tax=Niveomyces insectorum RCEF 264 TaxID=1081102 RepID=A0A167RCX9_9HYPO|nr:glycoside hydrolase family 61 protein [Niveomyces insectorum RCEF 264]
MKSVASLLLLAATAVQGHYTFPRLVVDGKPAEDKDWTVTRMTKNAQSKMGVTSVTSPDIRCYQARDAPAVATVPAGATVHYIATQQVNHPGPTQYYLARVPAGSDVTTWDGSGAVWFKFHTEMPFLDPKSQQLTWAAQNTYQTANATVPLATPPGDYLLRVEQIALHLAQTANGAQFYLACSQVHITGSGTGTPGPLVAFPGAYKTTDPGILVNLGRSSPTTYVPPGPAVWSG